MFSDGKHPRLLAASRTALRERRFEIDQTDLRHFVSLLTDAVIRRIFVKSDRLLDLLHQLPHLIGRKLQTHLPRYRADVEADVVSFDRILLEYSRSLRFDGVSSLRAWNDYLHEGSHGCIGLLRGWIRDALNHAWLSDAPALAKEHLKASRKTVADLQSLAAEIRLGEERLGYCTTTASIAPLTQPTKASERKRRKRPFVANPRRFGVDQPRSVDGK